MGVYYRRGYRVVNMTCTTSVIFYLVSTCDPEENQEDIPMGVYNSRG